MSEIQLLRDGLIQVGTDYSHLQDLKEEMDNGNREIVGIYEKREEDGENSLSVLIDISYISKDVSYIH